MTPTQEAANPSPSSSELKTGRYEVGAIEGDRGPRFRRQPSAQVVKGAFGFVYEAWLVGW